MQLFAYLVVVVLIGSGWCQYIANNNTMMAEPLSDSPKADLGEGPHFYAEQNALYYVDAFVGDVHRYDFATNVDESASLGDLTTIVIPIEGEADNLLVSLRNKVRTFLNSILLNSRVLGWKTQLEEKDFRGNCRGCSGKKW